MPASLVVPAYSIPRSTDLAVTVAPATAAPLGSVTVPEIVAVTSWAKVAFAPQNRTTSPKQQSAQARDCTFLIAILQTARGLRAASPRLMTNRKQRQAPRISA